MRRPRRHASQRTLSRGSDVVRSPFFGVGEDSHEMVDSSCCSPHAVERATSMTAGYDCVINATVRVMKGDDPRTDQLRKGADS